MKNLKIKMQNDNAKSKNQSPAATTKILHFDICILHFL